MANKILAVAFATCCLGASASGAVAAGETFITQAKALAGNVTPGDAPGFPVTLSRPGLYVFASNVLPAAGAVGIHVAHRNVTVDLNGFELNGGGTAAHGIVGAHPGTTIRNGTIVSFRHDGINGTGEGWIVEQMRVMQNGRNGALIGNNARAVSSTFTRNGAAGLRCGGSCHVEGNLASYSGGYGVYIESGMALGNTIIHNTGYGLYMGYGAFGNNTLILNNNLQSGPQVLGAFYSLHPNFCNPGCP